MRSSIASVALFLLAFAAAGQSSAPRVRLTEELRLDATAEDFPTVTRVYVGPRGMMIVPINADMQLRIYDSSGRRLGAVGRRGAGPGEFMFFGALGWVADTFWVIDARQQRTSFFAPDFTLLRTAMWRSGIRLDGGGEMLYVSPIAIGPGGRQLGQGLLQPPGETDPGTFSGGVAFFHDTGSARLVFRMPGTRDAPWMMEVSGLGRGVPFALQPQYAWAPDGSRFAQLTAPIPARPEVTFTVTAFRGNGDTVFTRTFATRGTEIPRHAVDSALAAQLPQAGRPTEGPADIGRQFQAMARERMSRWYIPVETLTLGLDQTVWIGHRPTTAGREYLVLDGHGDPVGSVLVPASTRIRQASATHIWVTETDDDGLSSVVRYRLSGIACAPSRC